MTKLWLGKVEGRLRQRSGNRKAQSALKERQLLQGVWNLSRASEAALAGPPERSAPMTRSSNSVSVRILQEAGTWMFKICFGRSTVTDNREQSRDRQGEPSEWGET